MNNRKEYLPIEVSARHIHLSNKDFIKLFGEKCKLSVENELSQKGQFSACETLEVIGPKSKYQNVRIIGPCRKKTQLEITISDSYCLGIPAPRVLISGDLDHSSGGLIIKGPKGEIKLNSGVIVAKRHLHIEPVIAHKLNIKNNDIVKIKVLSDRSLIFDEVVVRSNEGVDYLSFQIDTDEANAAGVNKKSKAILLL